MCELEDRIIAHHVGGRGFGVALNSPQRFSGDIVNVLYEADEKCALEMIAQNTNENFHVLPYCLGLEDSASKLYITNNPYSSSNLKPNPEYDAYYCEVALAGEIDGISMQDTRYDAVYGNENKVVEVRNVMVHALDTLARDGKVPGNLMPDFLSLDTQGSELDILRGAEATLHDHCVALATEIEFHPMYEGQALFSSIFDFALSHGFYFVGFTYLQEISPHRLPLGARAKGVVAFGDALFFRDIESVRAVAKSQNELYLMLLKLAFIALNFGYLEFALQAVEAADATKADRQFRDRLLERDCYRLLDDLKRAVNELPASFPHVERSKIIGERKAVLDRAQSQQADGAQPAATSPPAIAGDGQPEQQDRRIRHLLFTDPGAAIGKLVRHFRGPTAASSAPTTQGAGPTPVTVPPPSPHNTPVEAVLEAYGYVWWADVVRRRRKSAEHCVPGRMY